MFGTFLKEEKAQGAIEYILLAGGIIVAVVVIFAIYASMTESAAQQMNESTARVASNMGDQINNAISTM